MIRIFSYSKCQSCRKALNWLDEHKINYQLIDIVQSPPSKEIILEAINKLGDRKFLFNTSGKSYREIGSARIKSMSDQQVVEALCADGKLIKRPLLIQDNSNVLAGFKPDIWSETLL